MKTKFKIVCTSLIVFTIIAISLTSCKERNYSGTVDNSGKATEMPVGTLSFTEFEHDNCKYIAVIRRGFSESLQVMHKANCDNH
jgi:hypothetical protein